MQTRAECSEARRRGSLCLPPPTPKSPWFSPLSSLSSLFSFHPSLLTLLSPFPTPHSSLFSPLCIFSLVSAISLCALSIFFSPLLYHPSPLSPLNSPLLSLLVPLSSFLPPSSLHSLSLAALTTLLFPRCSLHFHLSRVHLSRSLALCLSLSHTHTHTLSLSLSRSVSLSHTHCLSRSRSITLSLTHTQSLSLSLSLSLPLLDAYPSGFACKSDAEVASRAQQAFHLFLGPSSVRLDTVLSLFV